MHAQFFNGQEFFEDREAIKNMIIETKLKEDRNMKGKDKINVYDLVCHFLRRRSCVHSKYLNSDLEKILIALANLPKSYWA